MTGAIIQARTGSTRLPSKVLLDLPYGCGTTLLERVVERTSCVSRVDRTIVATSTNEADDAVEALTLKSGVACFRGSEDDVLDRYYRCAREYDIDHIVRVCADSPFIDPDIVDRTIDAHLSEKNDYTGTSLYPLGTNVEIFTIEALESAFEHGREPGDREHVTPYIRRTPGAFSIRFHDADVPYRKPDLRLTVDVPEDYVFSCAIYDALYRGDPMFGLADVIDLVTRKPWIERINGGVVQKKVFDSVEEEMGELKRLAKLYDLRRAFRKLGG
jgi:spore coat polysaccharide biosynthesis protein SpsF